MHRFLLSFIAAVVFVGLIGGSPAAAQSQYNFVGIPFDSWFQTQCPPVCEITGSFTLAEPLPPNLVCSIGGDGCFIPLSFSFTDGQTVFNDQNSPMFAFGADTDAHGNITLFSFSMIGPGGGAGLYGYYGGPGSVTQEGVNIDPYQAQIQGANIPGGYWYLVDGGPCADDRDILIAEYTSYRGYIPQCNWFTQSAHSLHFTFAQLNTPCPSYATPEYSWAMIRQPLVIPSSRGYGLDDWQDWYSRLTGEQTPRTISSGYRDPYQNQLCGGVLNNRHVYGDAVDFLNVSGTQLEWRNMWAAAGPGKARADFREPINGPCGLGCVHADWRQHGGGYQSGSLAAHPGDLAAAPVNRLLRGFTDQNWQVRSQAFYQLLKLAPEATGRGDAVPQQLWYVRHSVIDGDDLTRALNRLLRTENAYLAAQERVSDRYIGYYSDLVWGVASLRDGSSLDALLGAIQTGEMATSAIASFAGRAIAPLLAVLNSSDEFMRESATATFAEMLQADNQQRLSAGDTQQVKMALLKAAADASPLVRLAAIPGLQEVGDTECVSTIRALAASDPATVSLSGESGHYPVRQEAMRALRQSEVR